MCYPFWKILSISGLVITLIGLIFLFWARVYGSFSNIHKPPTKLKRFIEFIGWVFTIVGYSLQIYGIHLS